MAIIKVKVIKFSFVGTCSIVLDSQTQQLFQVIIWMENIKKEN